MSTFHVTSYDIEGLDDPMLHIIDRMFAGDDSERSRETSGVRSLSEFYPPSEADDLVA